MTLLDAPPQAPTAPVARPATRPNSLRPSSWRLASRLARREVRRRPGRTALVALLVAAPIFAMTATLVVASTARDTSQAAFERAWGDTDLMLNWSPVGDAMSPPPNAATVAELLDVLLPAGASATTYISTSGRLVGADGTESDYVDFRVAPPETNSPRGPIEVTAGRLPAAPEEILLSRDVANHFDVAVGDTLHLARPSGDWVVVGTGRLASDRGSSLAQVADLAPERLRPGIGFVTLIDLPELPAGELAEELGAMYERGAAQAATAPWQPSWWQLSPAIERQIAGDQTGEIDLGSIGIYRSGDEPALKANELAWGWVAGAIALAAVGVVIAAAFASSARRQLTTIGQLSANGASPRLVSTTLALQGAWTGLVGTVLGIGIALVALPVARLLVEHVAGRGIGSWRFDTVPLLVIAVTGVAAATIAALVPARSAARVPVIAALAGRRPLAPAPRRLVPTGLALFVGGSALLVLVTVAATGSNGTNGDDDLFAATAVLGGLAVMAGMCCASPVGVDLIGRVGARLSGTARLAARSVARSRTRSAGVLTAIAITGAVAIAATTGIGSLAFRDRGDASYLPDDTVLVQHEWYGEGTVAEALGQPFDTELVRQVRAILPGASEAMRRVAVAVPDMDDWQQYGFGVYPIADAATLRMLELSDRDRASLEEAGGMTVWAAGAVDEVQPPTLSVPGLAPEGWRTVPVAAPRDSLRSRAGTWEGVVAPEFAASNGLDVVDSGIVFTAPFPLTADQRAALGELQQGLWQRGSSPFVEPDDRPSESTPAPTPRIEFETPQREVSRALVDAVAVAAALLMTLLVVAIGLSLSAAESRDERDVLVAVGGSPRTLRGLAGVKAVVLTVGAAVLAIPTGFVPIAAVISALPEDERIVFPWLTALGLVVVIPAIAGAAALATSTIAQRARPVRMSTLAAD